jgi:hypothetical protein
VGSDNRFQFPDNFYDIHIQMNEPESERSATASKARRSALQNEARP